MVSWCAAHGSHKNQTATCYAFCRRFIVRPMCSPTHSPEIPSPRLLSTCITLPPGSVTCLLSLLFSRTHSTHNGAAYLCSSRKPPCSTFSVKSKELWIPKSCCSDFSPPTARLHSWLPLSVFDLSVSRRIFDFLPLSLFLSFCALAFKHVTLCRSTEREFPPPPPPSPHPPSSFTGQSRPS